MHRIIKGSEMPDIRIERAGARFVARFAFSHAVKDIVKAAGFRFDATRKVWWTADPAVAARCAGSTEELAATLSAEAAKKRVSDEAAIAASRATDTAVEIPAPPGLEYMPYQKAGIAYALSRPATLIADEMGLGKTIQAIGVINADTSIHRAIIICPASLKLNWARELQRWLLRAIDISIDRIGTGISIINYERVAALRAEIDVTVSDLLVVDECHYLKNGKTKRTISILGKGDRDPAKRVAPIAARRRLFLTGTPVVNRPVELWPILHAIDPDDLGRSWNGFTARYCGAHHNGFGFDTSGATHLLELQAKLRASVMVRRLKADVLTELPPKRRQVVVIPANGAAARAVAAENAVAERHEARLTTLRVAVELAKAGTDTEYDAAVAALSSAGRILFTEISAARHHTAVAKLPIVIEHLRESIEVGKVVVMCHHVDIAAAIAAELHGVVLTGETGITDRQARVDRFQTDPDCRLFIGTIGAAGVGITLTAAAHVVFAELDWVPGNISQAEDRCHRIGQAGNVLIQHIVLDGSLDARMAEILVEKQRILDAALDRAAELPEARHFEAPAERAATAATTRKDIDLESVSISPEAIEAAHHGVRRIAAFCDGAAQRDGLGFSKIDAAIGRSLAECTRLSPRQAVIAAKLCQKYRRQLA
jgi:SWI/SNF-related matrix-associated actin-dependent regulator 1 of chromatin subfamily A